MRGPEVPVVRRPPAPGDAPLPRWWSRGNRFGTHLGNGMNFVFPAGERFFIRSVRFYADGLTDPALKARVAAFAAQEAWHQKAHLDLFADLESQGFEVRSFLDWYERWAYQHIEPRCPPALRLSTTAALEHLTATFAEMALDTPLLDGVDPRMAAVLRWHAAEEIEHRDVAFDVLLTVDARYRVRLAGFVMGVGTLGVFWAAGTRHLLRQDPAPDRAADRAGQAEVGAYWAAHGPRFLRTALRYLHPGFHPRAAAIDHLIPRGLAA